MCFVKIIWLQLLRYISLSVVLYKYNNSNARVCAQWGSTVCGPMDGSPAGSSVQGILQARTLEWVAISFFWGSSRPRNRTHISCIGSWFLYPVPPEKKTIIESEGLREQQAKPKLSLLPHFMIATPFLKDIWKHLTIIKLWQWGKGMRKVLGGFCTWCRLFPPGFVPGIVQIPRAMNAGLSKSSFLRQTAHNAITS